MTLLSYTALVYLWLMVHTGRPTSMGSVLNAVFVEAAPSDMMICLREVELT